MRLVSEFFDQPTYSTYAFDNDGLQCNYVYLNIKPYIDV